MEKAPLRNLVNKLKNYQEEKILREKEILCATYLCNYFKNKMDENFRVFKELYDTLPEKSQEQALRYCVCYMRKHRSKHDDKKNHKSKSKKIGG